MSNPLSELLERGEGGYGSYNRGRAGDANGRTIDFSQMTLGELQRRQHLPAGDPDRLFAVGKYQIIPGTMDLAVASLRLDPNQRVTPELQERIFSDYLISRKQPGIRDYITGQPGASLHRAQDQLAGEWASVADPDTGRSRYGGVGGNAASISAPDAGRALQQMRANYQEAIGRGQTPEQAWRTVTDVGPTRAQTQTPANPLADGVLSRNESGEPVRQLQRNLNQLGFKDERGQALETTSGVYGAHTAASVRSFQHANHLPETGVADRATLAAVQTQLQLPEASRNHPTPATPQPQGTGHWPAPGNTTINHADKPGEGHGEFGTSRGGGARTHKGVDIVGREGDPIQAYGGGTVHVKPNNGAAGNMVSIDHGNGVTTVYMHMRDINVRDGQHVEPGQQIGTMGRTGNTPRQGDTHLHFEYRVNGVAVDPMQHLTVPGRGQTTPAAPTTPAPTPATRDAMADGVLRQGERGADVRGLQQSLNQLGVRDERGHPLETRSGIYGEHTAGAVRNFQSAHNLEPTGIADQRTLDAIGRQLPQSRVTANAEVNAPTATPAAPQSTAPAAPSPTPSTPPAPREAAAGPLITDASHPNHALYTAIGRQMPGARPEAVANVTLQAMENGMTRPDQVGTVWKNGSDVLVQGSTPGFHVRVDTQAPTPPMQQMSDHMAKQSQQHDQEQQQRQQLAAPGR
ncbi:peptidoglycan-binding protein [Lysobacter gummosus]|uniref:peptidoglycan-binding protein n=1 Tax=Lysobacter gummosus TaxID=262324 RepID=UPI00363E5A0C